MPGIIQIDDINQSQALMGNNDEHLKTIETTLMSSYMLEDKKLPLKVKS